MKIIQNEAQELLYNASEYSNLFSQMSLLQRGRNQCQILKNNTFEISSATLRSEELDSARQSLANAADPENIEDTMEITPQTWRYVKNKISIKNSKNSDLKYSIPSDVFSNLTNAIEQRTLQKWAMGSDWDLGGYTFGQLKKLWLTLKALCIVYDIALESVKNEEKRLNFKIRIRNNEEWIDEITQFSKLPRKVVRQIVNDLTYDETLHPKAHVIFQPVFHFGDGKLGLSSRIVRISNIERNAWSLVKFLRPKHHGDLKNLKEAFWIQELKKNIEPLRLKVFPNIDYNLGNIDLLIIDEDLQFGLNCELKWLTKSDDVAGIHQVDTDIEIGVEQAFRASEWIK